MAKKLDLDDYELGITLGTGKWDVQHCYVTLMTSLGWDHWLTGLNAATAMLSGRYSN